MAATSDNGVGVAGVANSNNIKIMGLKILDEEGYGYGMEAVGAYNYIYKAQQLGVNVVAVNNSWGASVDEEYDTDSEIMLEVINMVGKAGAVSVCAAGNEGVDNEMVETIPANLDSPYIISVAATNENDELASFSNYGNNVDIAAPGTNILSTVSYDVFNPVIYENKDEFCLVYENFETGNLVQTMEDSKLNGTVAGDGEIAYGTNADGKGRITVSIEDGTYFGTDTDGTKSINWSIENVSEGDMYTLYLPYEAEVSSTPLHSSIMVKAYGPQGAGEDLLGIDMSMFMVADSVIDADGKYNEEEEEIIAGSYIDYGNYWNHCSGYVRVDGYIPYSTEVFGDAYKTAVDYIMSNTTDIVCINKKLYTVLSIDVGFAEESILVCYDEEKGWQKYADLPEDFAELTGYTLTSYDGNLYLIGGLNEAKGIMSKQVKYYDASKKIWMQDANLPEERCFAKAMQVGNKLVVTLGKTENESIPKALIFDGKEWRVSKADLGIALETDTYSYESNGEWYDIYYATAQTGLVKGGIVFTNLKVDGLGDTFTYDVVNDKYVSAGYCLNSDTLEGDELVATTVKDKLYVLYGWGFSDEDPDLELWKKQIKESDYYAESGLDEDLDIDMEEFYDISVCTMPIKNGYICVTDKSAMDAYVDGAGYYLPGDTIKLTAEAYEGFFVKSFIVNGKKINADSKGKYTYTTKATGDFYNIDVSTESGENITDIFLDTDYIMLEKSANKKLNSYKLYAEVFPDSVIGEKIIWTTSNANVATVDSDGKVSIGKKAKVGQKAVIRATAASNKNVYAECTVKIVKSLVKKGSKVKVGKFTYKVTKMSPKKNTLTVVSFNKKKAFKATVPATVKINGTKFKVTALGENAFKNCKKLKNVTIGNNVTSIGKNSFKGCKKLKKVVIKAAKVKKFGRGLFKGTGKKLVVKVPKKVKKSYKAKLKRAGFKGKVK